MPMFLALVFAVNNVAERSRDSVFMPIFTDEVKQRKRQTRIKLGTAGLTLTLRYCLTCI